MSYTIMQGLKIIPFKFDSDAQTEVFTEGGQNIISEDRTGLVERGSA